MVVIVFGEKNFYRSKNDTHAQNSGTPYGFVNIMINIAAVIKLNMPRIFRSALRN